RRDRAGGGGRLRVSVEPDAPRRGRGVLLAGSRRSGRAPGREMPRAGLIAVAAGVAAASGAGVAHAQRIETLSAEVRKYASVQTPKVVLEHVEVIDGTGAPPTPDRNVEIDGGRIVSITPGADRRPTDR